MEISTECTQLPETCDACQRPAEALYERGNDRLCDSCSALFWTAEVLFDNEVSDEATIIATMAFAAHTRKQWNLKRVMNLR